MYTNTHTHPRCIYLSVCLSVYICTHTHTHTQIDAHPLSKCYNLFCVQLAQFLSTLFLNDF